MTHKLIALAGVLLATSPWILPPTGGSDADGTVQTDLDLNGNTITDSLGAAHLCGSGTPGSAGIGDGYCSGDFEIDGNLEVTGVTSMSGQINFGSTSFMAGRGVSDDGYHLGLSSSDAYGNRRLAVVDYAYRNSSYSHTTLAGDPTIDLHSSTAPGTAIDEFSEWNWRSIKLGGDGGGLGCINETFAYDDMVDGGGASGTFTMTEQIPIGAVVQQAILHTLTGFTGDVSAAITIGDGTDVDRYNTGTPSVFTTAAGGVYLGVPSGTVHHAAAATVTVTVTTNADYTSVSAGQATVAICYWTP